MSDKKRLDSLIFEMGLTESRQRAQTTIMSGLVFVNGQRVDKPGTQVGTDSRIEIKGDPIGYVSRGGLKLKKALDEFHIMIDGLVCLDAGASTGGFTDCMLKNGAKKVYSVDVGYGQLAWPLRTDERVVCMERTNVRLLQPENIGEAVDFLTADLSFISLKLVLPVLRNLMSPKADIVCLIKPQFEAGKEKVGKKGVVRDKSVHEEVLESVLTFAENVYFYVKGLTFSPIKGPEGNIEYLVYLTVERPQGAAINIHSVVEMAHQQLNKPKNEE